MPGVPYVIAAVVFLASVIGAHELGVYRTNKVRNAEIAAIKSELETKVAQAQAKAAEVRERVVIQYKDRIVRIRETAPEVAHEIQVIRELPCRVPAEWVRLHNAGAGLDPEAPGGSDGTASCADAIETVRENYRIAREEIAKLEALQAWAKGVSEPSANTR